MKDINKTKEQLLEDLVETRKLYDQLEESEQIFRTIFENAADGILLADIKSQKFFMGNKQICTALGYSPAEIKNMGVMDIHTEKDLPYVLDQFDKLKRNEIVVAKDIPVKKRDGSVYYADVSSYPITLMNNTYLIGIFRDISDRKRTEEALRKSKIELKEAQRVGRIGSWDWDAKTDTITWSEEYYHIYGFDPTQRPPGYVEHLKAYTPESAARLDAAVKRNMQTGEPYELDLELARTDGPSRWIIARSETKRDQNGQIIGLRGTAQDITERKKAEEELRKSEERYHAIFENAPMGIFHSTLDGKLIFANPRLAQMLGYESTEELISTVNRSNVSEQLYVEPDKRNTFIEEVLSQGGWHTFEDRYRRKNGDVIEANVKFRAISNPDNTLDEVEGFIEDITELKRLEAEKRTREIELNKSKNDLEETNAALRVMLRQRDAEKYDIEQNIIANIKASVFPYIEKLKTSGLKEDQMAYCSEVESHLNEITSLYIKELASKYLGLTPIEIQVAYLIKEGKASKEIAKLLNASVHTVTTHRYHIRKKIGLKGKDVNLRTYLQNLK
jgi:PAS domain S-box-containing protein